jgi:glycosyltransferase involved in cell wall biosynthesis
MLFSIITVTYNPGRGLLETVESVLSQSCDDWELIIKDAGSTDGSLDLLPVDARIKIVKLADEGIYDAMNQAIEYCVGQYVCHLNAGDVFSNGVVLANVRSHIQEGDFNLLYGFMFNKSTNSEVRYPAELSQFFLFRNTICHQAQFLSADLLKRLGGYDVQYQLRADWELCLRANCAGLLRPKRISSVFVDYDGAGVSASSESAVLVQLRQERNQILRNNYSPIRLLFYKFLHALTLVELRKKIKASGRFSFLNTILDRLNHYFAK